MATKLSSKQMAKKRPVDQALPRQPAKRSCGSASRSTPAPAPARGSRRAEAADSSGSSDAEEDDEESESGDDEKEDAAVEFTRKGSTDGHTMLLQMLLKESRAQSRRQQTQHLQLIAAFTAASERSQTPSSTQSSPQSQACFILELHDLLLYNSDLSYRRGCRPASLACRNPKCGMPRSCLICRRLSMFQST
jgi:hypothetical protein